MFSEESAAAVKTIRTILSNVEDHGVVDIFKTYSSQDIAASLYAFYRLQRVARHYEAIHHHHHQEQQQQQHPYPKDLLHVLEDLSHYAVYATAAYGWKMDLAFHGKFHLGDEQALIRKTGIRKEDILASSFKAKAHMPVFFLVRDRERQTLVLCVRGTWSARDLLTDLCCTIDEYGGGTHQSSLNVTTSTNILQSSQKLAQSTNDGAFTCPKFSAHHGMLEAAMAVALEVQDVIKKELKDNPEYSLVLVGHSMGGGVAALIATLWQEEFPNTSAYLFGGPCVAPLYSLPTNNSRIINVISEGDPFRCLSLGHIADLSTAVAELCEEPELRRSILMRTDGSLEDLEEQDIQFCWEVMEDLRRHNMTNDKMYPPGRIFHVSKLLKDDDEAISDGEEFTRNNNTRTLRSNEIDIHEVPPQFFRDLVIGPRMFDISKHLPSLYETTLRKLIIEMEEQHKQQHSSQTTKEI